MSDQQTHPTGSIFFIQAISPIHIGCEEGLGAINAPTMREKITGMPLIPGSSIKGVLRDDYVATQTKDNNLVTELFGPDTNNAELGRSGMAFGDARLLALPVRSLDCMFIWLTCPWILHRLQRDSKTQKKAGPPQVPLVHQGVLTGSSETGSLLASLDAVFIEDHRFERTKTDSSIADDWARWIAEANWKSSEQQDLFKSRFAIVPDNIMGQLCQTSLEVRTRVRIDDDTGTAAESGPWSEEIVPAETLFHGVLFGRATAFPKNPDKPNQDLQKSSANKNFASFLQYRTATESYPLRFGGKSTVGYGQAALHLVS